MNPSRAPGWHSSRGEAGPARGGPIDRDPVDPSAEEIDRDPVERDAALEGDEHPGACHVAPPESQAPAAAHHQPLVADLEPTVAQNAAPGTVGGLAISPGSRGPP